MCWDRAANNENDADSWLEKTKVYVDAANAEGATLTCKFTGTGFELFGARAADWASSNTK